DPAPPEGRRREPARPLARAAALRGSPVSLAPDPAVAARLAAGRHASPHDVLGAHPDEIGGVRGVVVRGFHPDAVAVDVVVAGAVTAMTALGRGLFAGFVPGAALLIAYRLRFR